MKNYICPACGNSDIGNTKVFFDGNQKLLKCKVCKLIFRIQFKTLNQRIEYFSDFLSKSYEEDLLKSIDSRSKYKVYILKSVKKYLQNPDSFLDIGCSIGSFLNIASTIFLKTKMIGIEPSKAEVSLGERMFYNIKFINSYYKKELFESEKFDIIHHSHVIEHIIKPKDFLENNYFHLKKGGILLLSYPSAKTLAFFKDYLTKNYPGHVIQDQHFNYFTSESMRNLLKKVGFEILDELYGLNYLKRNMKILKFTIDPIFKLLKIGEPYTICTKSKNTL